VCWLWWLHTDTEGIHLKSAIIYTKELIQWRKAHLSKGNVPTNLAANWDLSPQCVFAEIRCDPDLTSDPANSVLGHPGR